MAVSLVGKLGLHVYVYTCLIPKRRCLMPGMDLCCRGWPGEDKSTLVYYWFELDSILMLDILDSYKLSIVVAVVCIAFGLLVARKRKQTPFPRIPLIPSNSKLLGFTAFSRIDIVFPFIESFGAIAQFFSYGHHVVIITEPAVAKRALRDINGKGFFHNPNPTVIEPNTFNAQTGPEWQKRRGAFRKAFSNMCLRKQMESITSIVDGMMNKLQTYCDTGEVIRIDDIFSSLTIQVITKIAFGMDISDERSEELRRAFESIFEVIIECPVV